MSSKQMGNLPANEKVITIHPGVDFHLARLAVDHYIEYQWPQLEEEYTIQYAHTTGENSVIYSLDDEECLVYPTRTQWIVKPVKNRVIGIVELKEPNGSK